MSDPSTAMPTTRIVPIANDWNTMLPAKNMPAIAIITVRPEMSTAWPEVRRRELERVLGQAPGVALLHLAP